jgi:low affinity Fe/Cu permease
MATRRKKKAKKKFSVLFDRFSGRVTYLTGRPMMFIAALTSVLIWAALGFVFGFTDTWQLIINTGTTIITFLMVFVIQQSQNKDTMAMHLKLNELIAANKHASNRLIDIEDLTEEELETVKTFYIKLAEIAKKKRDLFSTHSLDSAADKSEQRAHRDPGAVNN